MCFLCKQKAIIRFRLRIIVQQFLRKQRKMAELQISTSTAENQLKILISFPDGVDVAFNFTLTISIFQQNVADRSQSLVYKKVFHVQQKQIIIKDLKYSCMYKVSVENKHGPSNNPRLNTKNIFVYTPAQRLEEDQQQIFNNNYNQENNRNQANQNRRRPVSSVNSQKKRVNIPKYSNDELCNSQLLVKTLAQSSHIVNKNKAHKFLLESRKCRNVAQFINQKNGKRVNRSQVSDKRMLVIQSKLLFGEIYKYREGCKFFQNNWCMGPFYSFDQNEKQIRRQ